MQKKRRTSSSYVIVSPRRSKKEKKQVGWSVSLRKRRTEKPIESRRKKTGVCVQHYWQISFAFLRKFIFCCKYFNFLFVGCLNFEFTFICQLRGSYRRPSRSLSVYISPQQRRLSSSIDIYFPLFEYCCCSFFVTYRQNSPSKEPPKQQQEQQQRIHH